MTTIDIKGLAFSDNKNGYFLKTEDGNHVVVAVGDELFFSKERIVEKEKWANLQTEPKEDPIFDMRKYNDVERVNFAGKVITDKEGILLLEDRSFNPLHKHLPISPFFANAEDTLKQPFTVLLKRKIEPVIV